MKHGSDFLKFRVAAGPSELRFRTGRVALVRVRVGGSNVVCSVVRSFVPWRVCS